MSVNIILKTGGDTSSREYRDALKLKNIFEKSLSSNIYGDILIYSSAILFGQKIKDIDIICCGKFKNLNLNIKCRVENTDKQKKPSDKESNILIDEDDQKLNDDNQIKLRDVRIRDFIFCIENKSHPINQIVLDGLSLKVKYQNGKLHDASDQSEQQKYSLKSFLSDKWNSKKIPYICNFIWLTDVDPDSLKQLVGERDVDILKNNYLPSDFGLRWLFNLAAIQKIPIYSKKYPNPSLMSSYSENINNDKILKVFEEFNKFKEGSGVLTRKKIEKINKRLLKGQKYEKAIGEKLLIISGRAGTGKTLKLINIAFDLANFNNKRCLILTYNKALVSDIKRLLAIADISDDFSENTIEISTVHKFIYELIFAFGLTDKKFIEDFIVRYNSYLDEIYEYISEGALTKEDIQSLAVSKHQIISWDYVFIDESQDWITKEKDLLFKLFSSHNFIIADGVDQMVRKQSKCDWKNNLNDFHKISEKRCFRQKRNLVEFLNSYAEEFNLNWEVEPLEENIGGRIVISEIMNDYNLFIK